LRKEKRKEKLVKELREQLKSRHKELDFSIVYILKSTEILINIHDALEQNTGDYNTIILHYSDDKSIIDYLVEIDKAIEYKQFDSFYIADSTERFLISLFNEYDLMGEYHVVGGELYSNEIEENCIPLKFIYKIDYEKDKHTVKLYDEDIDIFYHQIDLNNNKYYCITREGKEETELEELQYKIEFLVNAKPFDFDFRVENDALYCKTLKSEIYDTVADLKDIKDIAFYNDCIAFIFKDDSKYSSISEIFLNKEGEIYA